MQEFAHELASPRSVHTANGPPNLALHPSAPHRGVQEGRGGSMRFVWRGLKVVGLVLLLSALGGGIAFLNGIAWPGLAAAPKEKTVPPLPPLNVELVPGRPHTLRVPEDVRAALGIRKGGADVFGDPERVRPARNQFHVERG